MPLLWPVVSAMMRSDVVGVEAAMHIVERRDARIAELEDALRRIESLHDRTDIVVAQAIAETALHSTAHQPGTAHE